MAIETGRGLPLYARIAAELREQIASGELPVGSMAPGEHAIAEEHGVSRYTAAKALDTLAAEGLISRRAGRGSVVTGSVVAPQTVPAPPGTRIRARLPRPGERGQAGAAEWEPVIEVSRPGQPVKLYPADSTMIVVTG